MTQGVVRFRQMSFILFSHSIASMTWIGPSIVAIHFSKLSKNFLSRKWGLSTMTKSCWEVTQLVLHHLWLSILTRLKWERHWTFQTVCKNSRFATTKSSMTTDPNFRHPLGYTKRWRINTGYSITLEQLMVQCPQMELKVGLKTQISLRQRLKGLGLLMEPSLVISQSMATSLSQQSTIQDIWLLNGRDRRWQDSSPSSF